jgi:hypothetical protein
MMALARGLEPRFMHVDSVPPSLDGSARTNLVDRRVIETRPSLCKSDVLAPSRFLAEN